MLDQPTNRDIDSPWQQLQTAVSSTWSTKRWTGVGVVVACSGGADSVALLRVLQELATSCSRPNRNGFLVVAHYNHQLRGTESDTDAAFVRDLAERLGLRCIVESSLDDACDEAALRDQRYEFLTRVAQKTGARYVALAHSMDDNAETLLHHLMRGTGPSGLTGISPSRPLDTDAPGDDFVLSRPLLTVARSTIREALQEIGQDWREDSSNNDQNYRRNWIRKTLIPTIQSKYPDAVDAIARAIELQREWRGTIDELATTWIDQHTNSVDPLILTKSQENRSVIVAALQILWRQQGWPTTNMDLTSWRRIAETISSSQTQRYSLPGDIDVTSSESGVSLTRTNRPRLSKQNLP